MTFCELLFFFLLASYGKSGYVLPFHVSYISYTYIHYIYIPPFFLNRKLPFHLPEEPYFVFLVNKWICKYAQFIIEYSIMNYSHLLPLVLYHSFWLGLGNKVWVKKRDLCWDKKIWSWRWPFLTDIATWVMLWTTVSRICCFYVPH